MKFAGILLRLCAAGFFVVLSIAALQIASTCERISTDIHSQLTDTRKALQQEVTLTRDVTVKEIAKTRAALLDQFSLTRTTAKEEIQQARWELIALLDKRTGDIAGDIKDTTADLHELQQRALEREPMIYSRFLATTGELNRTLDATRRAAEEGAKAAPQIVSDVTRITDKAADYIAPKEPPKKKPFYLRWLPTIAVTAGKILF